MERDNFKQEESRFSKNHRRSSEYNDQTKRPEKELDRLSGFDNLAFKMESRRNSTCSTPSVSTSTSSFNNSDRRRLWKEAVTRENRESRNLFSRTLDETYKIRRRMHFKADNLRRRLAEARGTVRSKNLERVKERSSSVDSSVCRLEYQKVNIGGGNKIIYSSVLKNYDIGFLPKMAE